MSRVDLLMKLTIDKDRRTNKGEVEQHSVKHALSVFSENLRRMLLINLLYAVIFALPFLFCVFIWPMLAKNQIFGSGKFNFIGQVGIGYPGEINTLAQAYAELFEHYSHVYIPVLSASFVPLIFGLSGVCHCMRGYMWGENVRPVKSFFRGIKKLWKPFLVTALLFAAFACGIFYGLFWHVGLMKTTGANGGSWVLFIFLLLLAWFGVTVLTFLLPMFACYRFKWKDAMKNSTLLSLILWPTALFTSAFTIGWFMFAFLNNVFNYIFAILFIALGFVFLAGIWTSSAQKAFGNYILPQYESEQSGGKLKIEARRGVNPYKAAKAKKKARENSAIGVATQRRAEVNGDAAQEPTVQQPTLTKKKKLPTKRVSYKRKK